MREVWFVVETGGDDKQAARLTKELRAAAQKAKTEFDSHRMARKTSHQRWSSTDEDYMPEERQSRSAVHDDLDSRSCTSRDSRSLTDGRGEEYPSSRQQRVRNEDGYRLRRYSRVYDDDNDDDDDDDDDGYVGNGMRKTNQNRSSHTSSPCKLMFRSRERQEYI